VSVRHRGFAVLAIAAGLLLPACAGIASTTRQSTRTCVYSSGKLDQLSVFERRVHTRITCALIFDADQPTWMQWEDPWFINTRIPNQNWMKFAGRGGNQLIISVNLIPDEAAGQDWRSLGAQGYYWSDDRALARNLVASGMSHAIIRLGHEGNGTWGNDNIGTTPQQWSQWKQFWRSTVFAMRSVPGAHFTFNWCISNGFRPIPFADYYPGNDVVNSIGVDVYDLGVPSGTAPGYARWQYQYDRPGGLAAIAAFAKRNHKPLAIPEWGLEPTAIGGGGDNPAFVRGIAAFVRKVKAPFQSYFMGGDSYSALSLGRSSLRAYIQLIGGASGTTG
jgi:hypothetical protein